MLLALIAATQTKTNAESCKDIMQGYLTGQLSSALGAAQIEALRREFKSFTDVVEKSIKELKENMNSTVKTRTINFFKLNFLEPVDEIFGKKL